MTYRTNREIEDRECNEFMKELLVMIGLTGICYSFLWIDAKPIMAILGMIVGLIVFLRGSAGGNALT